VFSLFVSCQNESKTEEKHTIKKTESDKTNTSQNPELEIIIKKDHVRLLNTSTATIAEAIRPLLFSDNHFSIEEFLEQKISFRNNKGKLITVPVHTVLDAKLKEKENPEKN
jgi:hypothetical protein